MGHFVGDGADAVDLWEVVVACGCDGDDGEVKVHGGGVGGGQNSDQSVDGGGVGEVVEGAVGCDVG